MEKLYQLNNMLAKIPKLGKLQLFLYPMICFGLFACAIILIAIVQYLLAANIF